MTNQREAFDKWHDEESKNLIKQKLYGEQHMHRINYQMLFKAWQASQADQVDEIKELRHCVENRAKQWAEQHIKIAQLQLDNAKLREALEVCKYDCQTGEVIGIAKEALSTTQPESTVRLFRPARDDWEGFESHWESKIPVVLNNQTAQKPLSDEKIDAERYRYLRNNTSIMTFEEQTWVTSHKLDMRVDKAMSKQGER